MGALVAQMAKVIASALVKASMMPWGCGQTADCHELALTCRDGIDH
ncbi:hypothetical protein VAB18032_15695 [Micromonospora maris AB-18-032]|nr:hypothetical protein VAB18032_15695 [Micromonospora maris AB-18-032]